jgi:hypothetical protein
MKEGYVYRNFFKGSIGVLLAVVLTTLIAVPALAADMRAGQSVTVASGEVVNGDLYVVGAEK